ncbi:MAG: hypothetical protein NVV59_05980 [Chitinophagaceae bacterium]|nr:hypothetical protein [Chitinophagaceae bacterium]
MLLRKRIKKGFVYFFKYTSDKAGNKWQIASVGLIPNSPKAYLWPETEKERKIRNAFSDASLVYYNSDYSELSDVELIQDEPVRPQLEKQLRRLKVGASLSGSQFYDSVYDYQNQY